MNQADIWELILAERKRQDEKWGELPLNLQHHIWLDKLQEEVDEVDEALMGIAVDDRKKRLAETELIHCAAVIVSWLEDRF